MSDSYSNSLQTLAMCGLGALTAFSAYKVFSISSTMEQQNKHMLEMQQRALEEKEQHRKEQDMLKELLEQAKQASNN